MAAIFPVNFLYVQLAIATLHLYGNFLYKVIHRDTLSTYIKYTHYRSDITSIYHILDKVL